MMGAHTRDLIFLVNGDVGDYLAALSCRVAASVRGSVGSYAGLYVKRCAILAKGRAQAYALKNATESWLRAETIGNSAGGEDAFVRVDLARDASGCVIQIHGDLVGVNVGEGATECQLSVGGEVRNSQIFPSGWQRNNRFAHGGTLRGVVKIFGVLVKEQQNNMLTYSED